MALPRQQQNNLDRDLRNHEARLKHPGCSQEEAAVHQMLLTLGAAGRCKIRLMPFMIIRS
jgi:hypothetical protein